MKKKIVTMLLIGTMALSITACGGDKELKKENNAKTEATEKELNENDSNMSQSEWIASGGADNMEDGYEIVDSINIDTEDISLVYTGLEILDSTDDAGNPIKQLVVYCDFTNKTSNAMSSSSAFSTRAFQNGVELQGWGGSEKNESLKNSTLDIMDGATLNVGFLFDLRDSESPVKFRITDSLVYEGEEKFAQQQEIKLQ